MSNAFKIAIDRLTDQPCAWSNLGYWYEPSKSAQNSTREHQSRTYQEACEQLADWVAVTSDLSPRERILDLCVGDGASVTFWLKKYHAVVVDAVELRADGIAKLARERPKGLGQLISSRIENQTLFNLIPSKQYDRVICIDALYHLKHPNFLWHLARHALRPGGTVGVCTLVRYDDRLPSQRIRNMLRLAKINLDSIADPQTIQSQLTAAGFGSLRLKWGTEPVLAGFASYVEQRAKSLSWRQRMSTGWLKIAATAHLAKLILADKTLGYATFAAQSHPR